jgi:asparagine synthase (glutamine-hydrolysing)
MCGIAGIWGKADREAVARMVHAMRHRGPDQHGLFQQGPVTLGMARLSILDLSDAGRQPMSNAQGTVTLVYNGELFNFRQLRDRLKARGHTFVSTSDTEVVLRLYEEYGDECLRHMRGMFALGVFDRRAGVGRERLLLARDQVGIKPLLYAHIPEGVIFASEMKAMLASERLERAIDPVALRLLLTLGSVLPPRSLVRNVRMLLPGQRLLVENGRARVNRYWSLQVDRRPEIRKLPYQAQVEALRETLQETVRQQLVSDVPVGAFLSGGVDSSILVALMSQEASGCIKTFSIGFDDEGKDLDEGADACRMARHLGTEHHAIRLEGRDVAERLEHFFDAVDQPSVDGINSYFVSAAARRTVTVAISGTGGDELFAGYPWFRSMVQEEQAQRRRPWRHLAHILAGSIACQPFFDRWQRRGVPTRVSQARMRSSFVTRYAQHHQVFGLLGANRLLAAGLKEAAEGGRALYYDLAPLDELPRGTTLERVTALCLRGYCANQLLRDIDAVSMSHSLEVRVPLLDTAVVDFALSLPDATKLGPVQDEDKVAFPTYQASGAKRMLIDVGRQYLPPGFEIQPKRGFNLPMNAWLRGPLRERLEESLSVETTRRRGWLDVEEVTAVKNRFFQGQLSWPQPWLLLVLEGWARRVLHP